MVFTILSVNVAFKKSQEAGNSSIAECWPSIHKTLGPTPSTAKSKKSDLCLAFASELCLEMASFSLFCHDPWVLDGSFTCLE